MSCARPTLVIDTCTLISAALYTNSVPYSAVLRAYGLGDVCVSAETLNELGNVLSRRKFDRYRSKSRFEGFYNKIESQSRLISQPPTAIKAVPTCRDPKDNKFLLLAMVCKAPLIISSDDDLLVMNPWNGIRIIAPNEFMNLSDQQICSEIPLH